MSSSWKTGRMQAPIRSIPHPVPALRLAIRSFRREPTTAAAAILILALGVGAAATIFAVLHGFDRPLPVPEGERVVRIRTLDLRNGTELAAGSAALETWASAVPALMAIGAFRTSAPVVVPAGAPPLRASAAALSPEVLPLLGVEPELGRTPRPGGKGAPREVVIGDNLWRVHFAGDPDVLGRSLELDGRNAVIVGVMPTSFGFPISQNLWWVSPRIGRTPTETGGDPFGWSRIRLVGRLADGISGEAASAQLEPRFVRYYRATATDDAQPTVRVVGFTEERGERGERIALLALLGLVILLVLVSCANVASLLHSRSVERAHLLTVHAALGAGPGQLALQVLGEALFLAMAGGASGLLGAWVATRYIETTLAGNWGYHWMRVAIDPSVVLFTAGLVVVVTFVAGIAPALRSRSLDLVGPLKARTPDEGARSGWGSATLLGAQVAFSTTALVAATLMAVGMARLGRAAGDLPAEEILIASVSLDADRYTGQVQRADFRDRALAALGRIGSGQVALSTGIPGFRGDPISVEIRDEESGGEDAPVRALVSGVTPGFFEAFDLGTLRGRGLEPGDASTSEPVAVVSSDFARRHLAGRDAIGVRLSLGEGTERARTVRVVGIVESPGGESAPREWIYVPIERRDPTTFFLVLRVRSGEPGRLAPAIREAVRSADPELPLDPGLVGTPVYALAEILGYVQRFYRTTGTLAVIGAAGAVLVALLGLYGVLTLYVRRRIREMGVRMALGARPHVLVRRVLRRGTIRVLPGLAAGLLLAWVIAPAFGLFLAGAEPRDPAVFAFAAVLYVLGSLAAAGFPAIRAALTDPARVLRDA